MITTAIYCRVSTETQETEGTSLLTQYEACLKYCHDKGYKVAYRFDEVYSGLTLDRPRLDEMRDLIRDGDVDIVVVYALDRITRDPTHGVILFQELEKYNVTIEAVSETVDSSEVGKLISYIRGFASKLEAEKIRDRTLRGKAAHVKMGKFPCGTGIGLYGYQWDKESKKRVPIEYEVRVVDKIFTMLADGLACSGVAKALNDQSIPTKAGAKWDSRTISRMSTNPAYIGITYYGQTRGSRKTKLIKQPESSWDMLPDTTPAIISKELFDRVQLKRQKDREIHRAKNKHEYMLRSHVICGYCGSPLVGSFLNHRYRYYHCRGTYPTPAREKICNARYIRADCLEDVVWQNIKKVLENPEVVLAGITGALEDTRYKSGIQGLSLDKEIEKLNRKIKKYSAQEQRMVRLFRLGEVDQDILLDEINQLKRERENDQQQLENYKRTKQEIERLEQTEIDLSKYCNQVRDNLDNADYQEMREVLDMLDIKVNATPEQISIEGIIPLDSSEATHHSTNIGITTWM